MSKYFDIVKSDEGLIEKEEQAQISEGIECRVFKAETGEQTLIVMEVNKSDMGNETVLVIYENEIGYKESEVDPLVAITINLAYPENDSNIKIVKAFLESFKNFNN